MLSRKMLALTAFLPRWVSRFKFQDQLLGLRVNVLQPGAAEKQDGKLKRIGNQFSVGTTDLYGFWNICFSSKNNEY